MTRQRSASYPSASARQNSVPPIGGSAPIVIGSALTVQKETQGTANFSAIALDGPGSVTILSWDAGRTAILTSPVAGNNGNSHTQQFSQAYGNGFTNYSLRGYYCYNAAGSANHAVTGTKTTGTSEEATIGILVLSGGQIGSRASVVQRVAAGAGATLTSGTVTTTGPALLVAVASGDGNVNATAPTQVWPAQWKVLHGIAYGSGEAPNGHIPLYIATREVSSAGDYTVGIQMTINEGATIALYAVQN